MTSEMDSLTSKPCIDMCYFFNSDHDWGFWRHLVGGVGVLRNRGYNPFPVIKKIVASDFIDL